MPPETPHSPTEEQKIKARKNLLFEADAPTPVAGGPRKPFKVYLRETPATPLSGGMKAGLWAVGVLVLLFLIGSVMKFANSKPKAARSEVSQAEK